MRAGQRILAVFVVLGFVFGTAGVAQAAPTRVVDPGDFSVVQTASSVCVYGGVEVTNNTTSSADITVKINGSDWGSATVAGNGAKATIQSYIPTQPATFTVFAGSPAVQIASIPFVQAAFCGKFVFAYDDHCTSIDVTMTNNSTDAVAVNFTKLSGATFPVLLTNIPLAAGQTKTVNIPVTNTDPADPDPKPTKTWFDLAPRVIPPHELIEIHTIKGTAGTNCSPVKTPTPASPSVSPTTPAGDSDSTPAASSSSSSSSSSALPETGTRTPMMLVGFGLAFLLIGGIAILAARRARAKN